MFYGILKEVSRDDVIKDRIPEKFQPLVAVGHFVAVVRRMGECLEQIRSGSRKLLKHDLQ